LFFSYLGVARRIESNDTLWEIATRREIARFDAEDAAAFSPHGKLLAVRPDDDTLQIWDIPPRKPLGWFLGLAGLLFLLTLGGFWRQARRRKRKAALATEAIPCGRSG
jgi:hypothetical protein